MGYVNWEVIFRLLINYTMSLRVDFMYFKFVVSVVWLEWLIEWINVVYISKCLTCWTYSKCSIPAVSLKARMLCGVKCGEFVFICFFYEILNAAGDRMSVFVSISMRLLVGECLGCSIPSCTRMGIFVACHPPLSPCASCLHVLIL